jgi:hypothetical protein
MGSIEVFLRYPEPRKINEIALPDLRVKQAHLRLAQYWFGDVERFFLKSLEKEERTATLKALWLSHAEFGLTLATQQLNTAQSLFSTRYLRSRRNCHLTKHKEPLSPISFSCFIDLNFRPSRYLRLKLPQTAIGLPLES